jgi:hypothetical protein
MGFHLYVWGVVLFAAVILAVGIVQLFKGQFKPSAPEPQWLTRLAGVGVAVLLVVASLETLTTFMECGFGACPNDGGWNWWILR